MMCCCLACRDPGLTWPHPDGRHVHAGCYTACHTAGRCKAQEGAVSRWAALISVKTPWHWTLPLNHTSHIVAGSADDLMHTRSCTCFTLLCSCSMKYILGFSCYLLRNVLDVL